MAESSCLAVGDQSGAFDDGSSDGHVPERSMLEAGLPTGTIRLVSEAGGDVRSLCGIAARANPRRGFLIVSRVLGRHLPARPAAMRGAMRNMAALLPERLLGPVVMLGMAETATALGQGVFAAYRDMGPERDLLYLQSSRQMVEGASVVARFEEGHSHATSHLVQLRDERRIATLRRARSLVVIDDECSTGATFVACVRALHAAMPLLERVEVCTITDWSDGAFLDGMPVEANRRSLLRGRIEWRPSSARPASGLTAASNVAGTAPRHGMGSRSGLLKPERANRRQVGARAGERVLVLGDGEHSYEALLVAEELERNGAVAAVQCITRSPALLGQDMVSASRFGDAYGSGAQCYLYNLQAHDPDRVVVVCEADGTQDADARAALDALGSAAPVERVDCSYPL